MASTYSPNLRLELIGTGDQQGTWGITTNTNLGTLLEQAIGGYQSVTVSDVGDTTLTASNGAADQSRNMVLNLTGTISAARNVICPAIEKLYVVKNATTGGFAVTFKVSGQTGVSIPNGTTAFVYVDGTDARTINGSIASQNASNVAITGGTISGVTISGITDLAVADGGTGASDAATARTNLGVAIGTNVQAYDATLQSLSALGTAADKYAYTTGIDTWAEGSITSAGRAILDDADAAAQRTTLGLGSLATLNTVGTAQIDNNSVDGTKIALGSDAQGDVMYYNGTDWARLGAGTSGQVLKTGGAAANPSWGSTITFDTSKSLTGLSSVVFTNVPSWARYIEVHFADVNLGSVDDFVVQIGTSSGVVATGYKSTSQAIFNDSGSGGNIRYDYGSNGFTVALFDTTYTSSGSMRLRNITGNIWVEDHTLGTYSGTTPVLTSGGGVLDLGGTLDRVQILVASGTFDGGTVNISYS